MSDFTLVYDHFDPGTEGLRESLTCWPPLTVTTTAPFTVTT